MNELNEQIEDLDLDDESEVHTEDDEENLALADEEEPEADSSSSTENDTELSSGSSSEDSIKPETSGKILSDDNDDSSESAAEITTKNKRKRNTPNKWIKEVRYYQNTTDLLIPKAPFRRLVREIAQNYQTDLRFTESSFDAIQTAAEDYLIKILSASQLQAISHGTHTIRPEDMQMVIRMKDL